MSWLLILETNPMLPSVKLTLLVVLLAQAHPQPLLRLKILKFLRVKESLPLFPLPNRIS
jgi:hypothetical protein